MIQKSGPSGNNLIFSEKVNKPVHSVAVDWMILGRPAMLLLLGQVLHLHHN